MEPSRSVCLRPLASPPVKLYQKYIPGFLTEQDPSVYTLNRYSKGDIEVGTMEPREQRGLMIAAVCRIEQKNGFWVVPSQTGNGSYRVCLEPTNPFIPQCTCPDYEERKAPCKHIYAARYVVQRQSNGDGTETITETVTVVAERVVAERPTYKQNWPAYNAAQTTEKHRFQVLLHDLCQGIEEPDQVKGRPRASLARHGVLGRLQGLLDHQRAALPVRPERRLRAGAYRQGPALQHGLQIPRNARVDPDPLSPHHGIKPPAPVGRGRFRRG